MAAPLVLWESLNTFKTLLCKTPIHNPHDVFIIIWPWLPLLTGRGFCPRGVPPPQQPLIAWLTLSRTQWWTFRATLHITSNNGSTSPQTINRPTPAHTLCLTLSVDSVNNYMSLLEDCFWGPHWPQTLCFLLATKKSCCLKPPFGEKNACHFPQICHTSVSFRYFFLTAL